MKKWLIIGGCTVVAIIIIVLVVGISNLGPIIKAAVNNYGPTMTKTEVSVEDVGISIFSGEAELKNFFLGNPKAFKSSKAMSVNSVYIDVDEKSVASDTIIIEKIEVVAPDITYEKIKGTDNFRSILNNVTSTAGSKKSGTAQKEKTGEKQGDGKKIIIRDFILRDGKVNLAMSMLGDRSLSTDLPDIHLKDIGDKKGGASPAEAFKEIFAALYSKITSPEVTEIFNEELQKIVTQSKGVVDDAKKQLETVGEDAKTSVKETTDKIKGLFGK